MAHCEGRMAGYKKPRSVLFAPSLPISPVGKVQRREVKESFGSVLPNASAGT
jgi:acyl-CoA synthetase (AMP-forming)/AMP-acid ligase II